ncbi:MAG: hypothetical protein ACP5F6_10095 [Microbacter sp.]
MKRTGFIILFFSFASFLLFSQSGFDQEAAVFHKKAIKICATVKQPSPNAEQMDTLVNDATIELAKLAGKYQFHPPTEYAGDPLWANYFDDWADNMVLVKTFVEKRNYALVAKYCNTFCRIFIRMHQNNNRLDLTDRLFMLNLELKSGTDMANAGHIELAEQKLSDITSALSRIQDIIKNSNNKQLQQLFIPIDTATKNWIKAIHTKNPIWAKTVYGTFSSDFGKLFLSSL